jgi:bifunctional non-homologous end joining protein LigD
LAREPLDLDAYRKKRSAGATPEPFGRAQGDTDVSGDRPLTFVVQKHSATRLHYDLRLELDGVLKSWAVPKGPSYDQKDKSLAMMTEDHPLEYATFEGVIPKGNYGAGEMIVWDTGHMKWLEEPHAGFARGKLLFELHGHKLRGKWTLVKIKKGDKEWLLIKERDGLEGPRTTPLPEDSVLSGRTIEDLKEGRAPAAPILEALRQLNAPQRVVAARDVTLMLATGASKPFSTKGWIYELKYDGYRMLAEKSGDVVRLLSRNGNDLTGGFPEVAAAMKALPFGDFILDGEVVVQDDTGMPRFQLLQKRARFGNARQGASYAETLPATLYAFDLPSFGGYDVRNVPLIERKRLLRMMLPSTGTIRFSEHVEERGIDFFAAAEAMGLEGMVAKKADSLYRAGRSTDWMKVRAHRSGDFVIVGFKASTRSRGFGSFHVAAYRDGELLYAGSVGTGVTAATLDEAWAACEDAVIAKAPCVGAPKGKGDKWVEPRLVCEVRYLEWTEAGNLRHPVFLGLRPDKPATECTYDAADASHDDESTLAAPPEPELQTEKAASPKRRRIQTAPKHEDPDVKLTNLDKIYWPEDGYTKGDLVEYYRTVSKYILPYLRDRPVVLTRFPDGIHGKSFFQKDAPDYAPSWLRTETVYSEGSERDLAYFIADDERSLLFLANAGSIPLHIWASRVATLERPDWCILDLDPKDAPFSDVIEVALRARDVCDEIGMPVYVKTSGSSGLHLLLPMGRQCTHDQSRMIGELIARAIVSAVPDIATITRVISKREGRVYIDYLQNGHGKLLVAPYCVRPLPGAPVSTPLEWREVKPGLDIRSFTIRTMPPRLAKLRRDPILPVLDEAPDLVRILSALQNRVR